MSAQTLKPSTTAPTAPPQEVAPDLAQQGWDLDISYLESGEEVDKLIQMTSDGCNSTCGSACTSC